MAQLAASQHAVVSRRQLLEIGLSKDEIWHRVKVGRLHRIHAGVYAVGHMLLPRYGLFMAAVLACEGGVLSHGSAAALLGLSGEELFLLGHLICQQLKTNPKEDRP